MAQKALWGGRFREPLAALALTFSSSIHLDGKLWKEDIAGSLAHVEMLGAQGILTQSEARKISNGLKSVAREIETGAFKLTGEFEDIHLAIEQRLTKEIGAVGGKLHTGRSRNDQVALDERLYLQSAIDLLESQTTSLMRALLKKAKQHAADVMPGYTHMQRAQPVLLGHHLLAYIWMLGRDRERLAEARTRASKSPLGAAAFAGTSYNLDRPRVAKTLGLGGIVENSIDAVSDRDSLIELASTCSIIMMHLSRLAEELVLWSTAEFRFVQMSDRVTTGSSIMPQKKNPDMAELVRGKTGKVYGALINLLTIMKGLPLAYNRDMQEDKSPMFDAVETTASSLEIMGLVIHETTYNTARMAEVCSQDYLMATELADYLVRKGLPFRQAHEITGSVVAYGIEHKLELEEIPLPTFKTFSAKIGKDVYGCLRPQGSIALKKSVGSTSRKEVDRQSRYWQKQLESHK